MKWDGMFKEIVESSDDILIVTDTEFKIRYISSSVVRIFGVEPFKLLGQNIFNFVKAEKTESWRQCLRGSNVTPFHEEISLRISKEKQAYFDVEVSNLSSKGGLTQGLMLKLHDISNQKVREKELIRSNQQLDQVIYKTTHDLKAPLMSALGLIQLAEQATMEEKDQYLQLIKKSLLKLDSFIEEMNHFFRNEKLAVQREKIDVRTLLLNELGSVENLYTTKIDITFEINGSTEFFSDAIRVKTIVANLLSNAIKYCDLTKKNPFIKISVFINEEFCEIRFIDNGIGIEPQYQERIFDLFFRGTDRSQGTGLGLFIVKDTVQRLKGNIKVESTQGEGSTFIIRIPNNISQPIEVG